MMNFFKASIEKVRFFFAMSRLFKSLHMSYTIYSDFLAFYLIMPISEMISLESYLAFLISYDISIFIMACSWISSISSWFTSPNSLLSFSISSSSPAKDSSSGKRLFRYAIGSKFES